MTLCIANLNQGICDWQGNAARIIRAISLAKTYVNPILVLPELATVGCDAGDLLLREDTSAGADNVLQQVLAETYNITVICGTIVRIDDKLYNMAAVLRDGKVLAWVPKRYTDITKRDDERWFNAWEHVTNASRWTAPIGPWSNGIIDVTLGKLNAQLPPARGITRCWLNARPFVLGEHAKRRQMLLSYSLEFGITLACANNLGSPDGTHVYDGNGIIVRNGQIVSESPRFVLQDVVTFSSENDSYSPTPYATFTAFQTTGSYPKSDEDVPNVEIELALVLALHDYLRRAHVKRLCLALSGGRDSAMIAVLSQRLAALRYPEKTPEDLREHMKQFLTCAYLPSQASSSEGTKKAALSLSEAIGCTCYVIPISEIAESTRFVVEQSTGRQMTWETDDLALQNLQARTRSSIIWMLANANNALLLTTGNLSEAAVGYATMDGDSSGGLAPIAGIPKTLVSSWLEWARNFHNLVCLDDVFAQPPSAELRPLETNQYDEADLMPYPVLDEFIKCYLVHHLNENDTLQHAAPLVNRYYGGDTLAIRRDFEKFVAMSARAQWKRNRFANGFKILSFDLDPRSDLRWPTLQG